MAESNKILTVSYGTFSCTLEGFDDAFTTMKAIAEYFRDLAADDRFFGAEPPTPDPELLARLASQSAARRVEARQSDTGIVLRQDSTLPSPDAEDAIMSDDDTVAEDIVDDEAEDDVAADAPAYVADEDDVEMADEAAEVEDDAAEVEAEDATAEETVAEEPKAEEPVAEEEEVNAQDAIAEAIAKEFAEQSEAKPEAAAPKARTVKARAISTSTAPARPAPKARSITHTTARPARPAARPTSDMSSVAAKLQRIRDVVSKTQAAEADFSEDQHAEENAAEDKDKALANLSDVDNTPMDPVAAAPAHVAEVEDDTDDAMDDVVTEADALMGNDDPIVSESWMSTDDEYDADEDDDIDLSAALAIANAPDEEAYDVVADADNEDDADDQDDAETDAPMVAEDEDDFDDEDTAEAPAAPVVVETPVKPARPVARVLKVKRRDFEAAVDDGDIEEDTAPQTPPRAYGDSTLDPEDEAELQNELKALENEIAGHTAIEEPEADVAEDDDDVTAEDDIAQWEEDEAEYEAEDDAAPVNPRSRLMDRSEGDMDRILAETNNQLGDSDGTRRRSAIAHLRAAVAATKAEKQAGVEAEDDSHEKADAYRDDLAQVVRPRRPAPRGDAPARRADDRPAPLKLVAAQRVDIPQAKSDGPVTPRRVRVADLAKQEEEISARDMEHDAQAHARASAANAASFTEFAERVGAYELPDILEAAASYLSFVEGREEFTRPQLMGKARQAMMDEFSREDGLRHFGRLLREGKLRKIAAGQFTVSDRINFRPEERIAG
ncbi:hypothetical protein [Pseudooceanicola sp. MF1-13]|uniref:hypothetical protein n=1 Tax=Pseudooceanicola sp. MF1-13 TaxID=3379095 RepID=UPI0038929C07